MSAKSVSAAASVTCCALAMVPLLGGDPVNAQPAIEASKANVVSTAQADQALQPQTSSIQRYCRLLASFYEGTQSFSQRTKKENATKSEIQQATLHASAIRATIVEPNAILRNIKVTPSIQSIAAVNNGTMVADVTITTLLPPQKGGVGGESSSWTTLHKIVLAKEGNRWVVQNDRAMPDPSDARPNDVSVTSTAVSRVPRAFQSSLNKLIKRQTSSAADMESSSSSRTDNVKVRPSASNAGYPTETPIDPVRFRSYALKWTRAPYDGDEGNDFNGAYPTFANNCANLASQSLHNGGWRLIGGSSLQVKDLGVWTYNLRGIRGASRTWSQSQSLMMFAFNTGTYDQRRGGDPRNARTGDLIFLDWDPTNKPDKRIDHTMVVTGFTYAGEPLISQKTPNRHHIRLSTSMAIAHSQGKNLISFYVLNHR